MTNSLDLYAAALKIFGSLGIVLFVVYLVFYSLRRFTQRNDTGSNGKMIQIVATQYLGGKKNITIIKVPGAYLVLGIAHDCIRLLTQFNDEDFPHKLSSEDLKRNNSFLFNLFSLSSNDLKSGNFHE